MPHSLISLISTFSLSHKIVANALGEVCHLSFLRFFILSSSLISNIANKKTGISWYSTAGYVLSLSPASFSYSLLDQAIWKIRGQPFSGNPY